MCTVGNDMPTDDLLIDSPSLDDDRYARAIARFDAVNAGDPNRELEEGVWMPKELLYARRMSAWLEKFSPVDTPETVQLAARAQHICRWMIPRSDYPDGKDGYKRWRTALKHFHAETAARILRDVGYDELTIDRVAVLLRKEQIKRDADVQLLEDVICLVFLEYYFADFAAKHAEAKVIDIVRKSWHKMSQQGHAAALTINLSPAEARLVQKALADHPLP